MNKYPSILKLIFFFFKVFTHPLLRIRFSIQIGYGPYGGKPKTVTSAEGIAHLMPYNGSGSFFTQTHPGVCVKQQYVKKD